MSETIQPNYTPELGSPPPEWTEGPEHAEVHQFYLDSMKYLAEVTVEKGMDDPDDKDGLKPGYIYDTPDKILEKGDKNYLRYMCRVGMINGLKLKIELATMIPHTPLSNPQISRLKTLITELGEIGKSDTEGKIRKEGGQLKISYEEVQRVKSIANECKDIVFDAYENLVGGEKSRKAVA